MNLKELLYGPKCWKDSVKQHFGVGLFLACVRTWCVMIVVACCQSRVAACESLCHVHVTWPRAQGVTHHFLK